MANERLQDAGRDPSAASLSPRGFQYSRGPFISDDKASASRPGTQPKPLPHQPKGRTLTLVALVGILGSAGFVLWNSFFRYSAYGIVSAHVVDVSATTGGTILAMHVCEGAEVRQGQLIVTMQNLDAHHRLERITDELRIAEATLIAETAKLHWRTQLLEHERRESTAEYFEAAARLEQADASQKEVENRLQSAQQLYQQEAIAKLEFEQLVIEHEGQTERVARLREGLKSWQQRAETAGVDPEVSVDQLAPMVVKIESLKSELSRVRDSLEQEKVRSPVNGRVTKWHVRAGEFASKTDELFSVVEQGSLHVQMYLPQRSVDRFSVGDPVELQIAPLSERVLCSVDRVGDELQAPPDEIQRHYSPDEKLLPVHLVPKNTSLQRIGVPVGAQVRLASDWFSIGRLATPGSRSVSP